MKARTTRFQHNFYKLYDRINQLEDYTMDTRIFWQEKLKRDVLKLINKEEAEVAKKVEQSIIDLENLLIIVSQKESEIAEFLIEKGKL